MSWLRSRLLLLTIFGLLMTSIVPLVALGVVGLQRYEKRGDATVEESRALLEESALDNLEAQAADIAYKMGAFLRDRDDDLRTLAALPREPDTYLTFAQAKLREVWIEQDTYVSLALYREIAYVDLIGNEVIKIENDCFEEIYPLDCELMISDDLRVVRDLTFTTYKNEDYFQRAKNLEPDEIYVSRPTGNAVDRSVAFRGGEGSSGISFGQRYQGVVRYITKVYDEIDGNMVHVGYVTFALDQTHLIEFTAHVDPVGRSPVALASAEIDNFAYAVGSDGATFAHVRHSSISGLDGNGNHVPSLSNPDDPLDIPGNFYQMRFLNPIFPELMERAKHVSQGVVPKYTVAGIDKALGYAVIPFHTGPLYNEDEEPRGFGMVIVTANLEALSVSGDVLAVQIEDDLDTLTEQLGGLVLAAVLLGAGLVFVVATAVVVPIRSVTRFSKTMEERGLTDEEIGSLKARRGNTEVAHLARTFGQMAETVQSREKQIAELLTQTDEALGLRVKELSALEGIGRRLTATLDIESVLNQATESLLDNTEAEAVELVILSEDRRETQPLPLRRGLTIGEADTKFVAKVPVEVEDSEIGYFMLLARDNPFSDDTYAFAKQLAAWVSVAVTNARLFNSVERQRLQLEETNRKITEANQLKSEFLANMSHELRTPLNAIIGFSDMLLMGINGKLGDKQAHYVTRVRDNGDRLLTLVNDILDLARIEAGRVEIEQDVFAVRAVIDHLSGQADIFAKRRRISFVTDIDDDLPKKLIGDSQRIIQVISNLLSNAFKFTEDGSVTLKINADRDNQQWVVKVIDTGIGIPPHAIDYIFEEFRQVDGSSKRAYTGTGLGLAITKNLVRLMGGTIVVESTMGEGSTFTVTLPLIEPEKAVQSTQKGDTGSNA